MKNKLLIIGMMLLLLILAACGGAEGASESAESAETETTEQTETEEVAEEAVEAETEPALETDGAIIATTVAIVEIMDALELDLIGVPTTYKDLPARYDGLPEVGMAMDPDLEIILSLKPTDVLTATTLTDYVQDNFTQLDVPTTYMNLDSVDNMYDEILALGEKYNRTEQANALVEDFNTKLADVEARTEGLESPTVLILLGVPGSYLVGTENSYVGDLVRRAGGTNAIKDSDVEFISANTETLQQTDADIILRMSHGMPEEVVEMFNKEFAENDIWQHFKAVQNDRVYDLEETRFGTTANLAAVEALDELVDILYPELAE